MRIVEQPDQNPRHGALALRLVLSAASAALILGGAAYTMKSGPKASEVQFDGIFFLLVLPGLLPTAVYLFGVRTRRASVFSGGLLVGVTFLAWLPVSLVEDDAMRGVLVIPAFFITSTT